MKSINNALIMILTVLIMSAGCATLNRGGKEIAYFESQTSAMTDLRYIETKSIITRVDAAYLFTVFFPEKVGVEASKIPFDLRMQLYPSVAYGAVKRGIMNVFPDSTFKPDEPVLKYQLAIFLCRYMSLRDPFYDSNLKSIDMKDADASFFAYKPISIMIQRNIMEAEDGWIYPNSTMSGKEAIKYFYRVRRLYE